MNNCDKQQKNRSTEDQSCYGSLLKGGEMFQVNRPFIYKYDEEHKETEKLFVVSPFWFIIQFSNYIQTESGQ